MKFVFGVHIKKKTLLPLFMDTATSRSQFTIHRIPNFTMISVSSFIILIILLCSKSDIDKYCKKPWISRKLFTQWIFYAIVLPPFLLPLKKKLSINLNDLFLIKNFYQDCITDKTLFCERKKIR